MQKGKERNPIVETFFNLASRGELDGLKAACEKYQPDEVSYFLNQPNHKGDRLPLVAADVGNIDLLEWLIVDKKQDPALINDLGESILHRAAGSSNTQLFMWFRDHYPDLPIDTVTQTGQTVLHFAAGYVSTCTQSSRICQPNPELLTSLIDEIKKTKPDLLHRKDSDGCIPLHYIARQGDIEMLKTWCFKVRKNIEARNKLQQTALHIAARQGNVGFFEHLLFHPDLKLSDKDANHTTPLIEAARAGHKDLVMRLLHWGSQMTETDKFGLTPFLSAAYWDHVDLLRTLLETYGDSLLEQRDQDDCSAFLVAVKGNAVSASVFLLKRGLSLEKKDKRGRNALHLAAKHGRLQVLQWLLEQPLSLLIGDNRGNTVLHHLLKSRADNLTPEVRARFVECLMRKEPSLPKIRGANWKKPKALARSHGHAESLQYIEEPQLRSPTGSFLDTTRNIANRLGIDEIPFDALKFDEVIGERKQFSSKVFRGTYAQVIDEVVTDYPVAIKMQSCDAGTFSKDIRAIQKELKILGTMRHPHLVALFGFYTDTESGCFNQVMELMNIGSLNRALSERPTDFSAYVSFVIAAHVVSGLAYLHDNHLIHRHLNSSNVLISGNLEEEEIVAKITDFGYAKIRSMETISQTIQGGMSALCDPYTSPEGHRSGTLGDDVTAASDIYSYGMILSALLTKQEPFSGKSPQYIVRTAILGERPDVPAPEPDDEMANLYGIMQRCLENPPEARPAAKVLNAELESLLLVYEAEEDWEQELTTTPGPRF